MHIMRRWKEDSIDFDRFLCGDKGAFIDSVFGVGTIKAKVESGSTCFFFLGEGATELGFETFGPGGGSWV